MIYLIHSTLLFLIFVLYNRRYRPEWFRILGWILCRVHIFNVPIGLELGDIMCQNFSR